MELSLREITNTIDIHDQRINALKARKLMPLNLKQKQQVIERQQKSSPTKNILEFKQCVQLNTKQLDFGPCLPSSIHQRTLSLTLTTDLPQPVVFCMQIKCYNQRLNQLPQFVFAIKKDRQLQFTDCYRFRLSKKGKYDFVIGVKTPTIMIGEMVESQLTVKWQTGKVNSEDLGQDNTQQTYTVKLKQLPYHPQIQCTKQLISSQSINRQLRVLKFSQIKSKLKKQVKIPFTLKTESKLTLFSELLGVQHQYSELERNSIEIIPRQLVLTGSGVFLMTFKFNFTPQMARYLQDLQESNRNILPSYTLRRILVMKVAQTNIHFHFPIEVSFFLGNKSLAITE